MPARLMIIVLVVALAPALALAQRMYTWKDSRGVMHFSDQRPADAPNVQERSLGAPQPIVAESDTAASTPPPGGTPGAEPSVSPEAKGPARVILVGQKNESTAPQTRHLTGQVKNVGGETARRVSVAVNITDAGQGTPCLNRELDVSPQDLDPGDTGSFEDDIDTPCFLGNAGLEINPAWD